MAMFVQHNITAMNANRNLNVTTGALSKSTEKLSSGYRINRAGDDAAGLAISEKMRGQVRGLERASTNSQDGISLIQTAEGALTETHSILQRMRELAVQAASDTNTDDDRTQIQNEIKQLTNEVDRIATTTEFNTKKLLDGSVKGAQQIKAGNVELGSTFENGKVELTLGGDLSTAGFTDVIRIQMVEDFTAGASAITNAAVFSVTSLFGNEAKVKISETKLLINTFSVYGLTDTAPGTTAITIDIANVGSLKAGDVITISISQMKGTVAEQKGKESVRLQVGANSGQEVALGIESMKSKDLNIVDSNGNALNLTNQKDASKAISAYDMAIRAVSTERAKMGAIQNRLEHTIANLDTSAENLQSAESRIRDTDMAKQMTEYSKQNILMQAGQSMLAQVNQANQGVLSLLQ